MNDQRHAPGIISTMGTKFGRFEQVAAMWHSNLNGKSFSIPEFMKKPGILVLGYDPVLKENTWPINSLILKALTNEVLRQPETLAPRQWFVLDEFWAMGKLEFVHDLVNKGRSKGASVLALLCPKPLESSFLPMRQRVHLDKFNYLLSALQQA